MQNNVEEKIEEKIENSPNPVETAQAITGSENNPLVKEAAQIGDSNPHNDEINNKAVKRTFDNWNLYSGDSNFKDEQKKYIGSTYDVDSIGTLFNNLKNASDLDLVKDAYEGSGHIVDKMDWDKIPKKDYDAALDFMRNKVLPDLEKASQNDNYSGPYVDPSKKTIKKIQDLRKRIEDVNNYENEIDEYMKNNPEMYMNAARALTKGEFDDAIRDLHPHERDVLKKAWKGKRPRNLDDIISREDYNDASNRSYDIKRATEKELGLKGIDSYGDGELRYKNPNNPWAKEEIVDLAFENMKRDNPNLQRENLSEEDIDKIVQSFKDYAESEEGKAALKSKEQLLKSRLEMNGYFKAREEADEAEKKYNEALEALRSGSVQEKMDALRNLGVKVKKVKKGKKVDIVDENTGSSVEDVLEKELPDVKDTPSEDKTQEEESKMAERLSEDFENSDDLYNYLEEEGYLEDANPMTFDEGHTPEQPPRKPGEFIKNPNVMLGGDTDVTNVEATDDYGLDEDSSIDEDEIKSPYDFEEDYPGDYPENDFYLGMTGEDRELAKAAMREDGKYHPIRPTDLIDGLDFTPEERELAKKNLTKDLQLGKGGKVYKTLDQLHKESIDELTDLEKEILKDTLLETEDETGEEEETPGLLLHSRNLRSSSSGGSVSSNGSNVIMPDSKATSSASSSRNPVGNSMLGMSLSATNANVGKGMHESTKMDSNASIASKAPIPPTVNETTGAHVGGSNNNIPRSNGSIGSGSGLLFSKVGMLKSVKTAPDIPMLGHTSSVDELNAPTVEDTIDDMKDGLVKTLDAKLNANPEMAERLGFDHKYKHWAYKGISLDEMSFSMLSELTNKLDNVL